MSYEYDLEIIIPVANKQPYLQRIIDFKEFNLLNINKYKIIIKLLVGPEEMPEDIFEKWPCDVEKIAFASNIHVSKIYNYYLSLKDGDFKKTRWFAKFDDDSISDIDGIISNLDADFDCERDYYLATNIFYDDHEVEIELLEELGFSRWFKHHKKVHHECEGSILSNTALRRILNNEQARNFLERRKDIEKGFCDIALGCAARICKIHLTKAEFMTHMHFLHKFTLFGGHLAHIHFLSHDRRGELYNIFKKAINNKICPDIIAEEICDKSYLFSRDDGTIISTVKLSRNGKVTGKKLNDNETFWDVEDSKLRFLNIEGKPSTVFDMYNFNKMSGQFLFDKKITHMLQRVYE